MDSLQVCMANAAYKTHSHGACADFPSIRKILVNWLVEVYTYIYIYICQREPRVCGRERDGARVPCLTDFTSIRKILVNWLVEVLASTPRLLLYYSRA